ncbi:hypothetical protein WA556_005117, partial [Blastocystis sp. ATCC 50177/Nand II]
MLSVFADFLETDNDAAALQMLLHNRLICCLSDDRDMCIQHPEYAGDFFRLLLMYFNPTFVFLLDQHYPSWEDEMGSLLLDPTSCFTPTQLLIILESLQGVEIQSTLWLMLWFVDVISLHHDSRHATSFQQFLRDATSSSAAVSLLSVAQLLQRLPAASQDFISDCFARLAQPAQAPQPSQTSQITSFSLFTRFSDIVGPVLTTEGRHKGMIRTDTAQFRDYLVLDVRKEVAARNEFVNVESGCVEAVLYSSLSASQNTRLLYRHVAYSSVHAEESRFKMVVGSCSYPVVILADCDEEASLVALLLQKVGRCFVSVALVDASHPSDFPRLLDILLANDYTLSKPVQTAQRALFGGWSWWRKWRKGSDNETSSSEFYHSGSEEPSMEAKASAPPREGEGRSKAYFDAIHSCLDGLMMEINSATANTVIASHLLTIVHPLLYTHIVSVVAEGFLGHAVSAIQTYHNSQDSVASTSSARGMEGDYLLVLTQTKLLLLSPLPAEMSRERECGEAVQSVEGVKEEVIEGVKEEVIERGKEEVIERGKEEVIERVKEEGMEGVKTETKEHSKEVKEERSEELEEETQSDTNEAKEMVLVSTIADALEVFTSCSEEDIKELDWVNCDSFRVDFELTLSDVQMLNILVNEEKGNEQLIHIKVNEETSLFLQVDYPIFVVNELMNRIGHLQ